MTKFRIIRGVVLVLLSSFLLSTFAKAQSSDLKPGQVSDPDILVSDLTALKRQKMGEMERTLWHFKDGNVFEMVYAEFVPSKATEHPLGYHLQEEIVYVLDGTGYSDIKKLGEPVKRVDWKKGSMIFVPAMAGHTWVATTPAKLLSVTNALQVEKMGLSSVSSEFEKLLPK